MEVSLQNRTEAEDWSALGEKNNKSGALEQWFSPFFDRIFYWEKRYTCAIVPIYSVHYKTCSLNRKFWNMRFKVLSYSSGSS